MIATGADKTYKGRYSLGEVRIPSVTQLIRAELKLDSFDFDPKYAEMGTMVHEEIAEAIKSGKPKGHHSQLAFAFLRSLKLVPVMVEAELVSKSVPNEEFGGTIDLVAYRILRGRYHVWIVDWKTRTVKKKRDSIQLSGYRDLANESILCAGGLLARPAEVHCIIVELPKADEKGEFKVVELPAQESRLLRSAARMWHWKIENKLVEL